MMIVLGSSSPSLGTLFPITKIVTCFLLSSSLKYHIDTVMSNLYNHTNWIRNLRQLAEITFIGHEAGKNPHPVRQRRTTFSHREKVIMMSYAPTGFWRVPKTWSRRSDIFCQFFYAQVYSGKEINKWTVNSEQWAVWTRYPLSTTH